MAEQNVSEVVEEIRNATEEDLREVIESWYEATRIDGMKLGAKYIALSIFGAMQKHLNKNGKPSLRDYERFTADVRKIITVQITESPNEVVEEASND